MSVTNFHSGLDIYVNSEPLGFSYGDSVFGPAPELRTLNDIRQSLLDPGCSGPEIVYAIAMDVGKTIHKQILKERMLLFGVVTYATGKLGMEPIRSQGHIHAISGHSGWSPPELYEIWTGRAIIYMQETAQKHPGRCYAVLADPGDKILVPPGWAHCTISADSQTQLTFGAWCDREYGFEYDEVRSRRGLAFYPVWNGDSLSWRKNTHYDNCELIEKTPEFYSSIGIASDTPIYVQFEQNPEIVQFISKPYIKDTYWESFIP